MGGRLYPIGRLALFLGARGVLLVGEAPPSARAAEKISEQEAHRIGVAAYVYFYSLVTMEVTRKQLTNVTKPEGIHTPMNMFANLPAFPTADMRVVVRPNFEHAVFQRLARLDQGADDCLGSRYAGPLLLAADARHVDRRVCVARLADYGCQAGDFAIVPPGWSGSLPAGVVRIDAPTPYVWIIGRTKDTGQINRSDLRLIEGGSCSSIQDGMHRPGCRASSSRHR